MIERNVVGESTMADLVGQFVLNRKAILSYDCGNELGDNAGMPDRMSESEETAAFISRVRTARLARFGAEGQGPICTLLDIPQGRYKHYEKRTPLPHRFIPKFCAATGVSFEWLLAGEGKGPMVTDVPKDVPKRTRKQSRGKAA